MNKLVLAVQGYWPYGRLSYKYVDRGAVVGVNTEHRTPSEMKIQALTAVFAAVATAFVHPMNYDQFGSEFTTEQKVAALLGKLVAKVVVDTLAMDLVKLALIMRATEGRFPAQQPTVQEHFEDYGFYMPQEQPENKFDLEEALGMKTAKQEGKETLKDFLGEQDNKIFEMPEEDVAADAAEPQMPRIQSIEA